MNEQQYYTKIEHLIKKHEVSKRARKLEVNNDLVTTYWNVEKLIVEAQGGNDHAKYGNELIRKWANKFTKVYGKGYSETNLKTMRKFYVSFVNGPPLADVSWTIYRELLSIKDENKRNYFINLCIKNNLSKRELIKEIKSNSYERLLDKPDKIDIIASTKYSITTDMKNLIIIPVKNEVVSEYDLD